MAVRGLSGVVRDAGVDVVELRDGGTLLFELAAAKAVGVAGVAVGILGGFVGVPHLGLAVVSGGIDRRFDLIEGRGARGIGIELVRALGRGAGPVFDVAALVAARGLSGVVRDAGVDVINLRDDGAFAALYVADRAFLVLHAGGILGRRRVDRPGKVVRSLRAFDERAAAGTAADLPVIGLIRLPILGRRVQQCGQHELLLGRFVFVFVEQLMADRALIISGFARDAALGGLLGDESAVFMFGAEDFDRCLGDIAFGRVRAVVVQKLRGGSDLEVACHGGIGQCFQHDTENVAVDIVSDGRKIGKDTVVFVRVETLDARVDQPFAFHIGENGGVIVQRDRAGTDRCKAADRHGQCDRVAHFDTCGGQRAVDLRFGCQCDDERCQHQCKAHQYGQ